MSKNNFDAYAKGWLAKNIRVKLRGSFAFRFFLILVKVYQSKCFVDIRKPENNFKKETKKRNKKKRIK